MLHEVHNFLRLYYTVPITSATAEQKFSVKPSSDLFAVQKGHYSLILHVQKNRTDDGMMVLLLK